MGLTGFNRLNLSRGSRGLKTFSAQSKPWALHSRLSGTTWHPFIGKTMHSLVQAALPTQKLHSMHVPRPIDRETRQDQPDAQSLRDVAEGSYITHRRENLFELLEEGQPDRVMGAFLDPDNRIPINTLPAPAFVEAL